MKKILTRILDKIHIALFLIVISLPIFTIVTKWQLLQAENNSVCVLAQLKDLDGITLQELMSKIDKKYSVKTEYSDKDKELKKIEKLLNYDKEKIAAIQKENPLYNVLKVPMHDIDEMNALVEELKETEGVIDAGYGGKAVKVKLEENKSLQSKLEFLTWVICTIFSLCYLTYINHKKTKGFKNFMIDMLMSLSSIIILYTVYIGIILYLNIGALQGILAVASKYSLLIILGTFAIVEVVDVIISKLQSFLMPLIKKSV
ncbi:permease-like cell division protein FtsX [[Clostridium] innocuum]|uniref:permease-like cell division protein FtsX n=1 Tax=Clostridium innocuum TaxID=1522 RepID=UPI000D6ADF89|nr:permease-like cell division protein FtsX [[Clostridium] innocuum]MCR0316888.1 permease-like cell division protein FtsX [[Clostridium] innocuum]MCR0369670.1 permease-like cell division protein FtsX [[Clostridium] innocuum]MCR0374818.1 permease-like cell division protein FtsX [[Clostridium] innocuum]MCR0559623.1 permease-like cell division protein FtsX [[Clostridium] innocuum]MCR0602683.1 permease-like cell division protein FtsX [[Clostridium] innocuum]